MCFLISQWEVRRVMLDFLNNCAINKATWFGLMQSFVLEELILFTLR